MDHFAVDCVIYIVCTISLADNVWACVLYSISRLIVGLVFLAVMKVLAKFLARELLIQVCKLASIPCVCAKRVSQVTHHKVHYSQHFIILDKVSPRG